MRKETQKSNSKYESNTQKTSLYSISHRNQGTHKLFWSSSSPTIGYLLLMLYTSIYLGNRRFHIYALTTVIQPSSIRNMKHISHNFRLWYHKCNYKHQYRNHGPALSLQNNMNIIQRKYQTQIYSIVDSESNSISSSTSYEKNQEKLKNYSRLSLAPMMEYTDRHFRHLFRLMSQHTLLYTEMVAANAIAHEYNLHQNENNDISHESGNANIPKSSPIPEDGNRHYYQNNYNYQMKRYLSQSPLERDSGKSVLQLGGSDPEQLYTSAQAVMEMTVATGDTNNDKSQRCCDYTAINLNCGCPSPKVAGKGCFGAALMDDPTLVKDCCAALFEGSNKQLPITVKCRIGTDLHWESSSSSTTSAAETNHLWNMNIMEYKTRSNKSFEEREYQELAEFIDTISSGNVVTDFQIHARIAVLKTRQFSPSDNRKIPPLKYDYVHRLTQDFPHLTFSLNGGIETLEDVKTYLDRYPDLNGIMVGRGMAANPWGFAMTDSLLYQDHDNPFMVNNRWDLLEAFGKHADREELIWGPKIRRFILKAVQALFMGEPNAKRFRIELDRVGGLPKELMKKGLAPDSDPIPLSEYILNAANDNLSDDILFRSPPDSFERMLEMKEKSNMKKAGADVKLFVKETTNGSNLDSTNETSENNNKDTKSMIAKEWQSMREADKEALRVAKEEGEEGLMDYEQMLQASSIATPIPNTNRDKS